MKIVIAGAGVVGESLCSELSEVGNDVILIEKEEKVLNKLMENYDITGMVGNGASYETLLEAGADSADIFIAATESDELNIISSIIAKKIGAKFTIARVRNPEYSSNMQFVRENLGISLMLNPEFESAKNIANKLMFPVALSVENFFGQKANFNSERGENLRAAAPERRADLSACEFKRRGGRSADKRAKARFHRGCRIR